MSKIFITGGCGFLGSHIVDTLLEEGHEITVYDNLDSGYKENIPKEVKLIKGDILDRDKLTKSSKGHDIFSHHAAKLEITKAISDPADDLFTNAVGTINALQACVENDIGTFIGASSAGVYGQVPVLGALRGGGLIMAQGKLSELDKTAPNWPYGVSKLAAEHYARLYSENYDVKTTMLRYSIVYGPREWYGRALTMFMARLLEGARPVVFGKGNQIRDMVYVDDAVGFHNLAIEKNLSGVYNVCSDKVATINGIAHKAIQAAGYEFEIQYDDIEPGETSEYQNRIRIPSELLCLAPMNAKALRTGWRAETNLLTGVKKQWEWLQDHKERYTEGKMRV